MVVSGCLWRIGLRSRQDFDSCSWAFANELVELMEVRRILCVSRITYECLRKGHYEPLLSLYATAFRVVYVPKFKA